MLVLLLQENAILLLFHLTQLRYMIILASLSFMKENEDIVKRCHWYRHMCQVKWVSERKWENFEGGKFYFRLGFLCSHFSSRGFLG